ncbi:MAG: 30S ribosomal protein S16 [Patescibacteria group bacterium]|jgi:small subunit ribosomal protein S16|nr:30S ribosomal protein S16 [Patescibacteria group bacterium]
MVVIRLARVGKKKQAFYRVVVADSRRPVTAKFIKILGWYNPHSKELNIKTDDLTEWMKKGAQPSNSLAVILEKNNIKLPKWVEITKKAKKPKKVVEAAAPKPVETERTDKEENSEERPSEPSENETEIVDQPVEETPVDDNNN